VREGGLEPERKASLVISKPPLPLSPTNLATKCATHRGTHADGQTEGHMATMGISRVEPVPRDGWPSSPMRSPACRTSLTYNRGASRGRVRVSLASGGA